ncbi:MAG: ribose-phosphate diphosphokinase [Ilumatobacteraceae bacterium]
MTTALSNVRLVCGSTHHAMAATIAAALCCELTTAEVERFPDGELRPRVGNVRGDDVFVIAPTGFPVSEHLLELLLLVDACGRGGRSAYHRSRAVSGVRAPGSACSQREAVGARVIADALVGAGAQRLVVVDPHSTALEAMCSVPTEMITAVPVLARVLRAGLSADAVVVAPDLGAAKLAQRYSTLLQRPLAVVSKTRATAEQVTADGLGGDVTDRTVVIVDDMISTGATIEAAARLVLDNGGRAGIIVAATHGLLIGPACQRLADAASGIGSLLVSDSVPPVYRAGLHVEVHTVSGLLADAIGRLHSDQDMGELLVAS